MIADRFLGFCPPRNSSDALRATMQFSYRTERDMERKTTAAQRRRQNQVMYWLLTDFERGWRRFVTTQSKRKGSASMAHQSTEPVQRVARGTQLRCE